MAATRRTTLRSSKGTKLYAVRNKKGQFKDIQTYKRAHTADMRKKSRRLRWGSAWSRSSRASQDDGSDGDGTLRVLGVVEQPNVHALRPPARSRPGMKRGGCEAASPF